MKRLVQPAELAKASHMRPGDPRISLLTEVSGLKRLERFYNEVQHLHDLEFTAAVFKNLELDIEVADALAKLEGEHDDLLSEEDLLLVAEDLPNNSTAAALLFENVWATRFAQAVRNANGEVLMNTRIPNHVVEAVRQAILDAAAIQ